MIPISQDEIKCPGEDDGEGRHMETYSFFPSWVCIKICHAAFSLLFHMQPKSSDYSQLSGSALGSRPEEAFCQKQLKITLTGSLFVLSVQLLNVAISIPPLPKHLSVFLPTTHDMFSRTLNEKFFRCWDCNQKFCSFILSHCLSTSCTLYLE